MAAPGEFFPQAFASQILSLAQQQKQSAARLREMRAARAERNFLDKERLELAERAQQLQEFRAGAQFDPNVGQLRSQSAQGALSAVDEIRLERAKANLRRQEKLIEQADQGAFDRALEDFDERGIARFSGPAAGAGITALRAKYGLVRPKGGSDEQASAARTEGGPIAISEIPVPGGVLAVRIGGKTLGEQKQVADIQKVREDIRKTAADTALTNERVASTRILAAQRLVKARQAYMGMGDDESFTALRSQLSTAQTISRIHQTKVEGIRDRVDALNIRSQSALINETERDKLAKERDELIVQLGALQKQSPVEVVGNDFPGLKKSLEALTSAQAAAEAQAVGTQQKLAAGQPLQGPNPDVLAAMDKGLVNLLRSGPEDIVAEMADSPESETVTRDNAWQFLEPNITFTVTNQGRTGRALFHADPRGGGLIPLDAASYFLATKAAQNQGQTKVGRVSLSPRWLQLGWTPDKAKRLQAPQPGPTPSPPPAPEPTLDAPAPTPENALIDKAEALIEELTTTTDPERRAAIDAELAALEEAAAGILLPEERP